jgi:hypothetical protein
VYIIQRGNTDVEINFYMGFNDEKGKVAKIHYSWGFIPLDRLDCPGVTKVVVDPRKFVLPSLLWGFDSGN